MISSKVMGKGFRVLGKRFSIQGFGCRVLGAGNNVQGSGCWGVRV